MCIIKLVLIRMNKDYTSSVQLELSCILHLLPGSLGGVPWSWRQGPLLNSKGGVC